MLTGESQPLAKTPGMKVFAGTTNQDGLLICEATGVGSTTLLAGIVRLVAEAQGSKAPIQQLADRVSVVFVPIVVAIAALAFTLTWWLAADATQALIIGSFCASMRAWIGDTTASWSVRSRAQNNADSARRSAGQSNEGADRRQDRHVDRSKPAVTDGRQPGDPR
jgi:hypothetical protein